MFKGRYYPRGNIEDNSVGYNPCYVWQRILSVRGVVQRGSWWRIGDGARVKVMKDNWIPSSPDFKLVQPTRNINEDAKVSDLIDSDLGMWNKDLSK